MTSSIKKRPVKWWVGAGLCTALFLSISVYSYSKMRVVINGVKVKADIELSSESPLAFIKGNARNAIYISLNGREIFIDKDGTFKEPIALLDGLGVVTIEAQDKFGHTSKKQFQVVYKDEQKVALLEK